MISLENLSFVTNQGELQQESGGLSSGGMVNLNNNKIDDMNNKIPPLKCMLVRKESSPSSYSQSKYQQTQKDRIHQIKLKTPIQASKLSIRISFQLKPLNEPSSLKDIKQPQVDIFCSGILDLSDKTCNVCTVAALDHDKKFVKGFLSCNYHIYDDSNRLLNASNKLLNSQGKKVPIYIFGIRAFIHGQNQIKRAFLTISQPQKNSKNKSQTQKSVISNEINPINLDINPQSTLQKQAKPHISQKKLPVRRVQKNWLYYRDIIELQLSQPIANTIPISLSLYSFDFSTCQSTQICSYKGSLFVDFTKKLEMVDYIVGGQKIVASVQLKYCTKNEQNLIQAKGISSRSYLENALSPAQFVYDNRSFVSNASIVKDRHHPSLDCSILHSPATNLNKLNRNLFVKSKFHSVFLSNRGIPMDKQPRFPSPKKKLTDQIAYSAHRTLDINQLPTRQKYRYSSFGKDSKECLKVNAFSRVGPGAGRYRLPSVFDKY